MSKWPGVFVAAAVLTFLGLFFQAAGLALPWWFVINDRVYIGVWFLAACFGGNIGSGNCTAISLNLADQTAESGSEVASQWFYTIFQACMTAAVGLIFLCSVGFLFGFCGACKSKCAFVFSCVGLFLSALLMLPGLGLFGLAYIFLADYFLETLAATTFPYAALSSGLGCIITFVAAVTLAIALCTWNTHMSDDHDDEYRGTPMTQSGYTHGYDNKAYPPQGNEQRQYVQQQHSHPSNMNRPAAAKRY
ncbi:uncharacterized protein LOC110453023 [Mizuhopecten yessoensis]|uniref:Uncharacterized protein n=1 Tax=Mizuhopecten yessoensis TaxID=6573 RepID=A0A210QI93_MIZYE|nr:uncharacterized protein LOC110453023 [Mizuhopecten yessoensis]OWF48462.1 hypothetical protein KP79_PYT05087 [Mizuhopecten yessoensis]